MENDTKASLLHPISGIIELGGRKKLGIENDNEEKWRETEQSSFLTLSFYIG